MIQMNKKSEKDFQQIIDKYFTPVGRGQFITTTKDGDCYAVTTTRPSRPLGKRLTNYVLEVDGYE